MTCEEVIDGILERKKVLNATNQQIADASNVPKTTVDRILRKETPNPSFQTVIDIATAVGYDFCKTNATPAENADPALQGMIFAYEKRCEVLERESRLKTVQSNLLLAEKSRWIRFLTVLSLALVAGIIMILLYDVTNPSVGWFRG